MKPVSVWARREAFRKRLASKISAEQLEQEMTEEVIIIAQKMGWTIEYIMQLPPWTYNQVRSTLQKLIETETKTYDILNSQTLR